MTDHIEMTTICRVCGREWQPDHRDYVAGRWRVCPPCRGDPTSNDTNAPPERATGAADASQPYVSDIEEQEAAP